MFFVLVQHRRERYKDGRLTCNPWDIMGVYGQNGCTRTPFQSIHQANEAIREALDNQFNVIQNNIPDVKVHFDWSVYRFNHKFSYTTSSGEYVTEYKIVNKHLFERAGRRKK